MAKTKEQLFDAFAARVAEILRERFGMDPEPLLRTRPSQLVIEALVKGSAAGASNWYQARITPEQLEWEGPDAMAESFVQEYMAAFRAAEREKP